MIVLSRRQLARYAVDELISKARPVVLAHRLAATLAAIGRKKEVEMLLANIDHELEDRGLLARAKVTSARPLSDTLREELLLSVKKAAGVEDIILEHQLDQDIIGGVKIETAKHSWDKSLKRQLVDIKEIM